MACRAGVLTMRYMRIIGFTHSMYEDGHECKTVSAVVEIMDTVTRRDYKSAMSRVRADSDSVAIEYVRFDDTFKQPTRSQIARWMYDDVLRLRRVAKSSLQDLHNFLKEK